MNKGIIYEECKRYDNALDCYISAVDIFISLYKDSTGANSIDHVHLHILPFSRPIWNEIVMDLPKTAFNTVESYNALLNEWKNNSPNSYLLFQDLDQKIYYISDASNMPSQLFRKCLAPYLGAECWDWRVESYSNNILETISLFK